jgi:hypothetical protein
LFKHSRKRKTTGIIVFLAAAAAAFGAYAFTATNTVQAVQAGAGSAGITGYDVTNPQFNYDPTGLTVTSVTFNLDGAASDVKAALVDTPAAADWTDCGAAAAVTFLVTCTFDGAGSNADPVDVDLATKLSVVAVSYGTATVS